MSVSEVQQIPKPGTRMTLDEFHALNLPEESSLILLNGIVYDEEGPKAGMTKRSQSHARAELRIGRFVDEWLEQSAFPASAYSGEVGCELPDHGFVGIDVAVFGDDVVDENAGAPYIAGIPLLAVEILSPSDRHGAVSEKIATYLDVGVGLVWIVDCGFKTVTAYQPGSAPVMYSQDKVLDGGPVLPGFSIQVKQLFQ